jgi:hypothetical protein
MDEIWVVVSEFPSYAVTNYGTVTNIATQRDVIQSMTKQGALKVGLMRDHIQYTRSVKVLVADAFIDGRSDIFNTPIQLDGNPRNVNADNLLWRPRWFAWKYKHQFYNIPKGVDRGKLLDESTGEIYDSILAAATEEGLLIEDIFKSIHYKERVFPTNQVFSFLR